jgi:CheY-like chemotaxis protein
MTKPHTLLVVDDDAAMRQMLVSLLKGQGYEVHEAASADRPSSTRCSPTSECPAERAWSWWGTCAGHARRRRSC